MFVIPRTLLYRGLLNRVSTVVRVGPADFKCGAQTTWSCCLQLVGFVKRELVRKNTINEQSVCAYYTDMLNHQIRDLLFHYYVNF